MALGRIVIVLFVVFNHAAKSLSCAYSEEIILLVVTLYGFRNSSKSLRFSQRRAATTLKLAVSADGLVPA